ncbi:hypothetical protein ACMFMG_006140 [Clarireedia jacksonii]
MHLCAANTLLPSLIHHVSATTSITHSSSSSSSSSDGTQTLSLKGLVQRGGQIEERLQNELSDLEKTSPVTGAGGSRAQTAEITRIFALAAVTYLHVVTSGALPELSEIKESVSRTIGAIKRLTDAKLLRNLAWKLCITGCLAGAVHGGSRE